jgi:GxxExxY protein
MQNSEEQDDVKRDPSTYAIIGSCMEVHKEMSSGFHEGIYHDSLKIEFEKRAVLHVHEPPVSVYYKEHLLRSNYSPDFICYGSIVVEIKVLKKLTSVEESQILHYLKATKLKKGLLINFEGPSLEWKRFVL